MAAARLARDEGTEVTIAGRSQEKLIQAQPELKQVHTVIMDITDEGGVEKVFAGLSRVDRGLISAGIMLNGAIVNLDGSVLVPIVFSPSTVYTACRQSDVRRHEGHGQA